jgi:hypothetical protein
MVLDLALKHAFAALALGVVQQHPFDRSVVV